jgi:hypothetical protein
VETIERNEARDTMNAAVSAQIAAQGDHKAMNKHLRNLAVTAYPDEAPANDEALFLAKHGRGI